MKITLIGGRDQQQFPTISYGGIETCVENLAWGLHKNGNDFVCLVPKRDRVLDYPFEIIESSVPPLPGAVSNVWPFANSLPDLVRRINPDIIWSQSFWSAETLQDLGIPIICTFHDILKDGEKPDPSWFKLRNNTWYRFISKFQYDAWVDPLVSWQRDRSFQLYTGLAEDEYDFGHPDQRKDYYLWVGGFSWGWHDKGLDIFVELARRNPNKKFVAFGMGNREIERELKKVEEQLSNFIFPGRLNRGQDHRDVFKEAKLYLMPTQIPDTFPRTVLESISKGTPVLGTNNGALPEMIGQSGGYTADSIEEMEAIMSLEMDYHSCFEYSKAFGIGTELTHLLNLSEKLRHSRSKTLASSGTVSSIPDSQHNRDFRSIPDSNYQPRIATIINFCTNDYKFFGPCVKAVAPLSAKVIVPYADRFFDGSPENKELINKAIDENPEAHFVEFQCHQSVTEDIGSSFWHNYARWVGFCRTYPDIDFILFLDTDEIVETTRFAEILEKSDFTQYDYLYFSNYWYFREPSYRARHIQNSPCMVKRSVINKNLLFHTTERTSFKTLPNGFPGAVRGFDGKPLFHHYSWVRNREEMLRKVQTWGHSKALNWTALVEEEFSRDFNGTDFVFGYQYDLVEPYIDLGP